MIRDVIMPQLGMGMAEGTIAQWAVTEGQEVIREQPLLSVETEKVVTDLPAPYGGFVHLVIDAGTTVPIETTIARIAETKAEWDHLQNAVPVGQVVAESQSSARPSPAQPSPRGRPRVSGRARKMASEGGFDLGKIVGTGPGGRIVARDVAAAPRQTAAAPPAPTSPRLLTPLPATIDVLRAQMSEKSRFKISSMRRIIGERTTKAKNAAPHTHIIFEVEVTGLQTFRQLLRERENNIGARISMTAIHARALALACRQVPICNASLLDDEIILWDEVNIGIAVALAGRNEFDSGLSVPVLRHVESKGLLQIERELRHLVKKAREGKLDAHDVADATITLSSSEKLNTGGWMVGTPLLNLPQVVAFGPGAAVRKPIVRDDGQIVGGSILPCCLTFDHRALDGAPAAKLAKKLTEFLGHPELMLL